MTADTAEFFKAIVLHVERGAHFYDHNHSQDYPRMKARVSPIRRASLIVALRRRQPTGRV